MKKINERNDSEGHFALMPKASGPGTSEKNTDEGHVSQLKPIELKKRELVAAKK